MIVFGKGKRFENAEQSLINRLCSTNHERVTHLETPGAAVVLVATGIFVLVFLFAPAKGLLWRFMRRTSAKSTKGLQ